MNSNSYSLREREVKDLGLKVGGSKITVEL
jgi:hypothetical protein